MSAIFESSEREGDERAMRCGVVALAGRPNVGKSSLVNALLRARVAIVSPKPQTTRNAIRCIYNDDRAQIVFTDTPGLHKPKDRLGRSLTEAAEDALEAADAVCWLVAAGDRKFTPEDAEVLRVLSSVFRPVVLVVNKADEHDPAGALALYGDRLPFAGCVAVSARRGHNLDALIDLLLPLLPEGTPWYDPDILIDGTERFMASEVIRGRVLALLRDEVPHCVAVEIDEYKSPEEYPDRKRLYIRASLIVETTGQKAILIGSGGAMLKRIGRSARLELEELTGQPVYLDLWVKVSPHWRQSEPVLRRLGF